MQTRRYIEYRLVPAVGIDTSLPIPFREKNTAPRAGLHLPEMQHALPGPRQVDVRTDKAAAGTLCPDDRLPPLRVNNGSPTAVFPPSRRIFCRINAHHVHLVFKGTGMEKEVPVFQSGTGPGGRHDHRCTARPCIGTEEVGKPQVIADGNTKPDVPEPEYPKCISRQEGCILSPGEKRCILAYSAMHLPSGAKTAATFCGRLSVSLR